MRETGSRQQLTSDKDGRETFRLYYGIALGWLVQPDVPRRKSRILKVLNFWLVLLSQFGCSRTTRRIGLISTDADSDWDKFTAPDGSRILVH
jgi:hypothetical protein